MDTDCFISISSKEHLSICLELNKDPSWTLERIENTISELQEKILETEKNYLSTLDNKQYQKSLLERKGAKDGNNNYLNLFKFIDEEIKQVISAHNEQMDQLKADLVYRTKMKKIFLDMHPVKGTLSPRNQSPISSAATSAATSPRLSISGQSLRLLSCGASPSRTSSQTSISAPSQVREINQISPTSTPPRIISPSPSPRNSYTSKTFGTSGNEDSNCSNNDASQGIFQGTFPGSIQETTQVTGPGVGVGTGVGPGVGVGVGPGPGSASPKVTKLLKSNSFLKRSIDLMKGKS